MRGVARFWGRLCSEIEVLKGTDESVCYFGLLGFHSVSFGRHVYVYFARRCQRHLLPDSLYCGIIAQPVVTRVTS